MTDTTAQARSGTMRGAPWRPAIGAALMLLAVAAIEHIAGRPAICTCGRIALWHGAVDAENSQQLLDWYSPSHLIHGLILYALGRLALPRCTHATRLLAALAIECAWEVIENLPVVIDRYRTATIALGYSGDTILNSLADVGCMAAGFWLASRLPAWGSILLAIALELLTLAIIRDNLVLNVLMLLWPIGAVRSWQAS